MIAGAYMGIQFTKMQGAGNDFVLVESQNERDWSPLTVAMCDRHFGVGADGLLLVVPSAVADLRMQVFNSDGSEADACGNGLRCVVRYALHRGLIGSRSKTATIETMAGVRKAYLTGGKKSVIQVGMGEPVLRAAQVPVRVLSSLAGAGPIMDYTVTIGRRQLRLNMVSMGNPHAVHFGNMPVADYPLHEVGPKVETHEIFPRKTNFEVVRVLDRQHVEARVWERGVGETLACGSGACAIGVSGRLHDYTDKIVDIILPGGKLTVEWDGSGEVLLSGPAEIVFSGEYPDETVKKN
jgi:diaminopimelate epimerase